MSTKKTTIRAEETPAMQEQPTQAAQPHTCPRVYCGPSVRGVARQFTVYSDGNLPEALQDFVRENPTAAGLVVAFDAFAEMRRRIETPGTAENILYHKIKSKL